METAAAARLEFLCPAAGMEGEWPGTRAVTIIFFQIGTLYGATVVMQRYGHVTIKEENDHTTEISPICGSVARSVTWVGTVLGDRD